MRRRCHVAALVAAGSVAVEYVDRTASAKTVNVTLEEDPRLELVTVESTGRSLTKAEETLRRAWLGRRDQ